MSPPRKLPANGHRKAQKAEVALLDPTIKVHLPGETGESCFVP